MEAREINLTPEEYNIAPDIDESTQAKIVEERDNLRAALSKVLNSTSDYGGAPQAFRAKLEEEPSS